MKISFKDHILKTKIASWKQTDHKLLYGIRIYIMTRISEALVLGSYCASSMKCICNSFVSVKACKPDFERISREHTENSLLMDVEFGFAVYRSQSCFSFS